LTPTASPQRRIDLDWLRILAFGSLILYHVGMYYVTWDWHVKSPAASHAAEPLLLLVNPWRLALLFLVSGVATAYIAARMAPGPLARSRTMRLLVPLAFAILVLIPPQSYFEVVEKAGWQGGYWEFWKRYLLADRSFCRGGECLVLPTWNHLWFVAYLLVYTLVLAAVVRFAPRALGSATRMLERWLSGWGLLLVPFLYLALARFALVARFGSTHALVDDWYNHAQYFPVFVAGFLLARSEAIWEGMERMRWTALALGLASFAFVAWYFGAFGPEGAPAPPEGLRYLQRVAFALDQWAFIVAACGFARRHLTRDGPARRYLTDAIFPFYIVHQTAIIAFAVWVRPLALPPAAEAPLLIVLVALACVATYEIVKRAAPLRSLFGLKARAALCSPDAQRQ
jgi:peptidoglycan/LPS O-acetylase OafA/YrhL